MTTPTQQLNETVFVDNNDSNDTASLSITDEDRITVPAPQIVCAADPSLNGGKREVVFIESNLADYQTLVDGVKTGVEVVLLDADQSGLAQMAQWAETHSGYDAIHVMSHGAEGSISLGTDTVDANTLTIAAGQAEMAALGSALKAGGDLLIYGCDVAKGLDGVQLIAGISAATGADVAASTDRTGSVVLNGNWTLEMATGVIESSVAVTPEGQAAYDRVLASVPASSGTANFTGAGFAQSTGTGSATLTSVGGTGFNFKAIGSGSGVSMAAQILTSCTDSNSVVGAPVAQAISNASGQNEATGLWVSAPTNYTFDLASIDIALSNTSSQAAQTVTFSARNAAGTEIASTTAIVTPGASNSTLKGVRLILGPSFNDMSYLMITLSGKARTIVIDNIVWSDCKVPVTNAAPVLDSSKSPALTAQSQSDTSVPTGAVGALVSQLIGTSGIASYTDANSNPAGMAITATNTTGGTWYYTTNGGTTWSPLGSVSAGSARLLTADANTRLYLKTNGTYSGTLSDAITFRAWDGTSGTAGGTADTSTNGGSTTFSTTTDTASLTVNAVNVVPTFVGSTTTLAVQQNASATDITSLLHVKDTSSGQTETWTVSSQATNGTVAITGGTASSGTADITPGGTITYTPTAGYAGADSFTIQVSDGAGGTVSKTVAVSVKPAAPGFPRLAAASDTGSSNSDKNTNATSLQFTGTNAIGDTTSTIRVFIDVNNNGRYDAGTDASATATASGSGWSATIDASSVSDNAYAVCAFATSATGSLTSAIVGTMNRIDRTAGTFDTAPAISAVIGTGFTVGGSSSESATIYYVVVPVGEAAPNAAQVAAAHNATDGTPTKSGNIRASSGAFDFTATINGLTAGTSYDLYLVSKDVAGNVMALPINQTVATFFSSPTTTATITGLNSDTSGLNTTGTASDFITMIAAQTVSGSIGVPLVTGEKVQISVDGGTTWTDVSSGLVSGTSWSSTVTLNAGTNNLTARVTNAGGSSPADIKTYTLDTAAPAAPSTAIALAAASDTGSSSSDGITQTTNPTLRVSLAGTNAVAGDSIELLLGGNALTHATKTQLSATHISNGYVDMTVTAGDLSDGANIFTAQVTDIAGNIGTAGGSKTITLDNTAPAAPGSMTLATASDTGISPSDGITKTTNPTLRVSLTGTGAATGDSVELLLGGSSLSHATKATLTSTDIGNGYVDMTVTAGDLQSTGNAGSSNSFTARITDVAGNEGTAGGTKTVTLDTTAPSAPTTAIALATASDSGSSDSDGKTNDTSPTLHVSLAGTNAEPGDSLELLLGGSSLAHAVSKTLDSTDITNGVDFTVTAGDLVSNSANAFTARVTDAAGNAGTAGGSKTVTLDTAAPVSATPVRPDLTAPTGNSFTFTVTYSDTGGAGIDAATFASGNVTVTGPAPITVAYTSNSGNTATYTVTRDSGSWTSADIGTYTIGINGNSVKDLAGNAVAANASAGAFAILNPITASITAINADTFGSNTTGTGADFITYTAAQTVSGSVSAVLRAGQKVQISVNSGVNWTDATSQPVTGTTTWSSTATLLAGSNTFQARVTDAIGSSPADIKTYTLDTTAPSAASTAIALATASDSGSSSSDAITKTTNPVLRVSLAGTNAVAGDSIELLLGGSALTHATKTQLSATHISNGYVDMTVTAGDLGSDGAKALTARVTDIAGNVGTAGGSKTINLDTTTPSNTIATKIFSADTGQSGSDLITHTAAQTVSGTLTSILASGEYVEVSLDNGSTWITASATVGQNTWSLSGQTLTASNTLKVRVTDAAGNSGTAISGAYTLDSTAPIADTPVAADLVLPTGITPFTFTVTYSDTSGSGMDSTTFGTGNVTVTDNAGHSLTVSNAAASGNTVTYTVQPLGGIAWNAATDAGTYTIGLVANSVKDIAGNAVVANATAKTFTVSNPIPTTVAAIGAISNDTGTAGDFVTSATSQTISGTLTQSLAAGETVQVSMDGGTTWTNVLSASVSGTTWSLSNATLLSGTHTLQARVTNIGGSSTPGTHTYTLDATAPAQPAITGITTDTGSNTGDGKTSDGTLSFAGTAEAGASVELWKDGTATGVKATANGSGAYTLDYTATTLAEGSYAFTVKATDLAGNVSVASASQSVVVDTARPIAATPVRADLSSPSGTTPFTFSVDYSDTGGTGIDTASFGINNVTVTGPGSVTLSVTGAVASGNTVTYTVTPPGGTWDSADAGNYTIGIGSSPVQDIAGNTVAANASAKTFAVSFLTTPTTTATVTSLSSDNGITGDFITNTTSQTVSGTLSANLAAGEKVQISVNGGTTWTDASSYTVGSSSWTSTATLLTGTNTLEARVTNTASSLSSTPGTQSYTVDATVPTASTPVASDLVWPTGSTFTFTVNYADTGGAGIDTTTFGTGNVTVTGPGSVGALSVQSVSASGNTVTYTVQAPHSGAWDSAAAADAGTYTIGLVANSVKDIAGNAVAVNSTAKTFNVSFPAPTTTAAISAISDDTGSNTTDFITQTAAQTLSGTVNAPLLTGETVQVSYDNGNSWHDASAQPSGIGTTWSDSTTLAGSDTLKARVTNAAGSSAAASHTYTLDTTSPTVPGTAITLATASDSGSSNSDGKTNATTPTLHVSLAGTGAVEGDSVELLLGGNSLANTATIQLSANDISNGVDFTVNASDLSTDGTKAFTARAIDIAGNAGTEGGSLSIVLDTAAPTAATPVTSNLVWPTGATPITFSIAYSDTGTGINTNTFGTGNVTVTGPGSVGSLTVTNAVASGNTVTYTVQAPHSGAWALADAGTYTIGLVANSVKDIAGNAVAVDAGAATFTVSNPVPTTTAAIVSISADTFGSNTTGTNTDFITKTAAQTLGGTVSTALLTGETVQVSYDNGAHWHDASTQPSGIGTSWSDSTTLAGSGTLKARVTNAVGSSAEASHAYTLDTTSPTAPTTAITLATASDSGSSSSDGKTNAATPTLHVSLAGTGAAVGDSVELLLGGNPLANTAKIQLSANDLTNGVDFTVNASDLTTDGTKTFTARVTDIAGNVGVAGGSLAITRDTTVPIATAAAQDLSSPTGSTPITFTVVYADTTGTGIDTATFAAGNVTVTGPGGIGSLTVTNAVASGNTVTYTVQAPHSGAWNSATDAGTYTIGLGANPVKDTAGNAIAALTKTFAVAYNASPVLGGTFTTHGTVDDTATTTPFSGVTVTDAEGNATSVRIQYTAANGTLAVGSGGTLTGSAGDYILSSAATTASGGNTLTTYLQGLVFTPTLNQVAPASSVVTTFTLTANDGNTNGIANASTQITAASINDAPTLTTPTAIAYTDTATVDTFTNSTGTLVGADTDTGQTNTYGIDGGTTGATVDSVVYDVSKAGTYGTLYLNSSTGAYVYVPNNTAINALTANNSENFTVTFSDGTATPATATLAINLTGVNDTPTLTTPTAISYTDTVAADTFTNSAGTLAGADADSGQTKVYGISGGTTGATVDSVVYDVSKAGDYGTLYVNSSTGAYVYVPDNAKMNAANANASESFTVTLSDGVVGTPVTASLVINLTAVIDTPTTTVSGIQLSADTGSNTTDFITNTATQTVTATLSASLLSTGSSSETLLGSLDGGQNWIDITNKVTGTSVAWDNITPANGVSALQFKVHNSAADGPVATQSFTLDATLPTAAAPVRADFVAPQGTSFIFTVDYSDNTGGVGLDASTFSTGNVTVTDNASHPLTVTGVANTGNTVTYTVEPYGGSWDSATDVGTYTIGIVADSVKDLAGNAVEANSTARTFLVNSPTIASIGGPSASVLTGFADTGHLTDDFITKTAAQAINGTISSALNSGEKVQISVNSGNNWADVTTQPSGSDATWSTTVILEEGDNILQARVISDTGASPPDKTQTYTLDTIAPVAATPVRADFLSPTGSEFTFDVAYSDTSGSGLYGDSIGTDDVTVTGPGGTLTVTDGSWNSATGVATYTVQVPSGVWSSGTYTIGINGSSVEDSAGNSVVANASAKTFTVTNLPATTAAITSFSADNGLSSTDFITNAAAQTVSGTISGALVAGEKVEYSVNDGGQWIEATTQPSGTDTAWSSIVTLGTGANTLQARVTNAAGNSAPGSQDYTLDITVPTAATPVRADFLSPTGPTFTFDVTYSDTGGSGIDGASIGADDVTVTGPGTIGPLTVTGGSWAGGVATYTVQAPHIGVWNPATDSGAYVIDINADAVKDVAGNNAAAVAGAKNFAVNFTPTTLAYIDSISDDTGFGPADFITATANQTIIGSLSAPLLANEKVQYSVDGGANWSDVPAVSVSDAAWAVAGTLLSGSHTIKARVANATVSGTIESKDYMLDTTAPVFANATINANSLVMTYTETNTLDAANIPATTAFTVMNGATPITVNSVTVNAANKTVTLTLASAVANGNVVTVAYTDPTGGDDAAAIQDNSGNDAATLTATAVTNNTPAPSPDPSPEPTPTPAPVPTPVPVPTPAPVPTPVPVPTPAPVPTPVPVPTPTPTPEPTPVPVPTPTPEPTPVPTPTPVPAPVPTPTPEPTPAPPPVTTEVTVDGVVVTGTATTTTTTVTDPETGEQQTVTTEVVVTTVPIIPVNRQEENQVTPQADIPLAQSGGETTLQASLPPGVGLTSEAVTGGEHRTLRELLIAASEPRTDQNSFIDILGNGIDSFVPGVRDEAQVTVRTITFQAPPGASEQTAATDAPPIVITGASGAGEQNQAHPDRQEALIIDVRNLPHGTKISLNNVEFAIIVGAVRVTGGNGQNVAVGDDEVQYMVLGAEDDVLHGGGGDDTIGSKAGNDKLFGDNGNDLVIGGLGDDSLEGGEGNDILQGGQSDAGLWTFSLSSDGVLQSAFTAKDSELADGAIQWAKSGPWLNAGGGWITSDARVVFATQAGAKLETIALLYQAVVGRLPDIYELSDWSTQAFSDSDYAQIAYDAYRAKQPQAQVLETQVAALINRVWGSEAVTQDWVKIGSQYFSDGGNWAEAMNYLVHHDNFKAKLLDKQGTMALTQAYQSPELGWSSDTGNDSLSGGAGDDTLVGGRGHNRLDGGAGLDSAVVIENRRDYGFAVNSDGQLRLNHRVLGDSDILIGIEKVVFADRTVDVSASNLDGSTLKSIVGLYRLATGAAPNLTELNQAAAQHLSLLTVAGQLTHEPAYQSQWAGLSNSQFVTQVSKDVLGIPLTGADHDYWVGQLTNGLPREQVLIEAVGVASYQTALFGGAGGLIIA